MGVGYRIVHPESKGVIRKRKGERVRLGGEGKATKDNPPFFRYGKTKLARMASPGGAA